jgi:hypothetical protein
MALYSSRAIVFPLNWAKLTEPNNKAAKRQMNVFFMIAKINY